MHRDVTFALDTLTRINTMTDPESWLRQHLADLHEIGYGAPGQSQSDVIVQTSGERDLSDQIGRPAQHAWHNAIKAIKAALVELERAEYACNEIFSAGTSPEPDRPGRDTTMPKRVARQVHQAAARRQARGEYTPTRLDDTV